MRYQRHVYSGIYLVSLTLVLFSATFAVAQRADSPEVSRLLSQAKTVAVLAKNDAVAMDTVANSKLSGQSQATEMNTMRQHVNDLSRVYKQLMDARAEGSPWQQEAINRIGPLLRDLAAQLNSTVNYLNDLNKNQSKVNAEQYREFTHANADLTGRMSDIIRDFVEYGKAKSKVDALGRKLELPTSGTGQ